MERMPADLRKVLKARPSAEELWSGLTPIARRDFISWIESAKQAETRASRIERTPDMLISGKRRPCCYAIVPMNLYKALGEMPKAKAQWNLLTPDERRDFVAWVEEEKDKSARTKRIAKVCAMLVSKKRKPS